MKKLNLKKAAAIGMCCAIVSSGAAFAMTRDNLHVEVLPRIEIGIDDALLQKQREIDRHVFSTHAADIAQLGFTVTHTGPKENYIEVGILPYSEANANYLYKVLGKDKVRVVEGVQAILLPTNLIDTGNKAIDNDGLKVNRGPINMQSAQIQINGRLISVDVEPFIENSRTLIPLRGVMENLGARVEWHPAQRIAEVKTDDINIKLVIGEDTAKVIRNIDGVLKEEIIKLDVAAKLVDNRTFIPGRFVAETLGAKVQWDNSSRRMIIETDNRYHIIGVERAIDFEVVNPWNISSNENLYKWYQENFRREGIHTMVDGQWRYVLLSAGEKPTGGYSVQVTSITEVTPGTAYIHGVLNVPGMEDFVTQAFTYPSALVRFNKGNIEKLQGDLVDTSQNPGNVFEEEIGKSLKEMGKSISVDSIKEMKLYSLMDEELKIFSKEEISKIVLHLNSNPTYNGAYIMMLAGNNIKITLNNGDIIQLTSYGFKDHVILSGKINGEYVSHCIVSPEVGVILLSTMDI